ncbi:MAG: dipeptidase [Novosphingobium sp.]
MRKMLLLAGSALLIAAAPARSPEQVAEAALRAAPVWDGHNDVAEQLRDRRKDMLDGFDFADTSKTGDAAKSLPAMQTDLARLRAGHVGAQFWSVYVDFRLPEPQAVQATLEQIDTVKRLVARYPDQMQLATSADEVEAAMRKGKVASLIGMEGGGSIGSSLGVLRQMHALGARYLTLVHYKTIGWADSSNDDPKNEGLSPFGKDVVREMQRIGMLIDLSHASEGTMMDALDVAKAPVIFSHSSARAVDGHPRNVPDAVLDRLKGNGGIVMVTAVDYFVGEDLRQWRALRAGEEARLKILHTGYPGRVKPALDAWEEAHPAPKATLAQLADHIDHLVKRIGIDHAGIGADFDGGGGIEGLASVADYPALFAELARRGYSQADLEKLSSRNMLRVMRAAEAYALAHRNDPPIESPTTF